MDAGISSSIYQPTKLLERKLFLIDQLEKSNYKFETEVLDNRSLKYMLERLQGQQGYEIAIIRELDPYFNFQDKIGSTLNSIKSGKESRVNYKNAKIRNLK